MKLSFSLAKDSSTSSKPTIPSSSSSSSSSSPTNKEFITEFDPSQTLTDSNLKNSIVIPPIPNQWAPSNPLNLQLEQDPNISDGLNIREKNQSRIDRLMLMKLKSDLKRLPDGNGLDEFDDVSVEEFAPAYLKGYGWVEGKGIGKNATEDFKVVQYTKRTGTQGLGFVGHDHKVVKSKKGVCNSGKRVEFGDSE
ncbi:protein MOS2-like [Rutidosis leptorrhynchoides]|uniref:protein MOS2-like n=1 Tax=Rutidosis leptorrhynchoides TaxID=125765 RepID=UPI003A98E77E